MRRSVLLIFALLCLPVLANAQWIKQSVDTKASFRGLSVVNEKVVWASGTGGTVIRTIDGGKTWKVMTVPGAEKLDFRDIEAFDANTAYILSIGNGDSSRIYKTTDGGANWKLQFKNTNPKAFFDAMACWNGSNCIAMSDPIDGHFLLVSTFNAGRTWAAADRMPNAQDGEASFAASGTCLIRPDFFNVFIVTGGNHARVIHGGPSTDSGLQWKSTNTDFVTGEGSGIFSIAMFDKSNGVIVGGNYEKPDEHDKNLAFTTDGGVTWTLKDGLTGYRSGVIYVDKNTIVAVGTNGTDLSSDAGRSWQKIGNENLNAVQAKGRTAVWAAGPNGLVVKLK